MCGRTDQLHHPTFELRDLLVLLDDVTHRLSQVPPSVHGGEVMATISQHRQMVARWLSHPPSKTVQANAAATILSVIANANAAAHAAYLDTGSWRPVQAELRAVQHAQPEAGAPLYFDLDPQQGRGIARAVLRGDLVPTPLDWLPRAGTKRVCEVTVGGVDEPFVLIAECVGIETPDGVLLAMEPASDRQRERLTLLAEGRRVPARPPSRDELPTITETEIHGVIRRKLAENRAKPSATSSTIEEPATADERSRAVREELEPDSIDCLLVDYIEEISAETRVGDLEVPSAAQEPWRTPITLAPPALAAVSAPTAVTGRAPSVEELTWDDLLPKTTPPPPMLTETPTQPPPPFVPVLARPALVTAPPPPSGRIITQPLPSDAPSAPASRPMLETQELPDLLFANAPVGTFAHHSDVAHIAPVGQKPPTSSAPPDRATPVPTVMSIDDDLPAAPPRRWWKVGAWLLAASVAIAALAGSQTSLRDVVPSLSAPSPVVARSITPIASAVSENAKQAVDAVEAEATMVTVKRTLVRKLRR